MNIYVTPQLFHVLIERSKTNVSSQFSTMSIAHGQIARMCLANNSKVDKSRTRYLSSPFILPYVLRFKQRDAAKRHKACVIECRVTARM